MHKDTKIISEIGIFCKKSAKIKAVYSIMDVISSVRLQENTDYLSNTNIHELNTN